MKILYVSSVPSPQEFQRMKGMERKDVLITTYGMSESGFKFHTLIQNGMVENGAQVDSLIGRSISHRTHKGIYWRKKIETNGTVHCHHLAVVNVPILKQLFMGLAFFFHTLGWLIRNRKEHEKCIFMDASYVTVVPFVLWAAAIIKCPKVASFCDIYEYMGDAKDASTNGNIGLLHRIFRRITSASYRKLDGFVLLTEKMNRVINPCGRPFIVMEGLVDFRMERTEPVRVQNSERSVLYAGALREQYGLRNLVEGFMAYQDPQARLWIYGSGDYQNAIQEAAQMDRRIRFMGARPNDEVLRKEMQVTLLVNPRPTDREFTQYSFPSKNMEYMVSGTPLLTTKLPGMPKEYYDYIYTIDGDTPQNITDALHEVFSLPADQRVKKGEAAKRFVLTKKNNVIQAERILRLCREVGQ